MKAYETENGRKSYEETLAVVEKQFPQYVRELKGVADGSKIPFTLVCKLQMFLLYLSYSSR